MNLHTKTLLGLLFIVAGILLLALAAKETSGATITVAKSGGDYTSIQDAIDESEDGDTTIMKKGGQ
ncbi:MAG: hypothetical protein KAU14_07880 [Thermoplasmata archaeon]|nr:hypothetical protein [Thermoplasmata archaeon]